MAKIKFDYSPIEPAHPMHVKMQEYLLDIYRVIREKFQQKIDDAFDRVSSQIGYVLTTAVPVVVHFEEKGRIKDEIVIEGTQLKGTIFERALKEILSEMRKFDFPDSIAAGDYRIYVFWLDALKLKLRTDWIEPAHFGRFADRFRYRDILQSGLATEAVKPEVQEPVHWFDPWMKLPVHELIQVSVIDEIYPELRLIDKVRSIKDAIRWIQPDVVRPEVTEPVHRRPGPDIQLEDLKGLLSQLGETLRNYGF